MIDFRFLCQRGYTFVAEARTPNAILPPGKFRLRVIGSTEPLPYPGRDGVNSHFLNKEIRDYYIPNRYNVIFRWDAGSLVLQMHFKLHISVAGIFRI